MLIGSDSYKYKINTSVMSLLKCGQSGLLGLSSKSEGINENRDPEETGNKHWEMENRKSKFLENMSEIGKLKEEKGK